MVDILTNFTNDPTSWSYDRNDCYSYSLYLDIDDSKLYDYEFSSIVLTYKSLTENIDVDIPTSEGILNNEFSLRQHRIYRDKEKAHPSLKLNTQKYVHFSSAGRTESSRQGFPVSQIQIRQCEHDIQFGGLFSQPPISCFSISE